HCACGVKRSPHPLPNLAIPRSFASADIDTGLPPQREFGGMGARSVAARDERRALCLNRFQCGFDVLAFDPGKIALWPDQHEVVVHQVKPLNAKPYGEEFFLM